MERDEILENLKQKLITSLLKWERKVDWLYIKDLTEYPSLNYFKVWFEIKSSILDSIVTSDFHYIHGFKKDAIKVDKYTGDALFNLAVIATASVALEEVLADVNRETIIERFIYKKYLEES